MATLRVLVMLVGGVQDDISSTHVRQKAFDDHVADVAVGQAEDEDPRAAEGLAKFLVV